MDFTELPLTASDFPDPVRLAALLDGQLSESEASALRKELANADQETLTAFADATAIAQTLEISPRVSGTRRSFQRYLVPAFATLAAAAVFTVFVKSSDGNVLAPSAQQLPHGLHAPASLPWQEVRGEDGDQRPGRDAVRFGVLLADFSVTMNRNGDTRPELLRLIHLMGGVPGGSASSQQLRTAQGAQASGVLQRSRALFDGALVDVGDFLESARIGLSTGNAVVLQRLDTRILRRAAKSVLLADDQRSALDSLTSAFASQTVTLADIEACLRLLSQ